MSYRKIILILCLGIFLSAERNMNAQITQTFSYTGSFQTWTVPSCVTILTINCSGAQGGGVNGDSGGRGARMIGAFNVVPGEVLTILVGKAGTGTGNGGSAGGGGGGSFVMHGATPIIIAGGGGGRRDTGPAGVIANTLGSKGQYGQNSYDNTGKGGSPGNGGTSGEPNGGGTGGPGGGLNTNGGLDGSAGGGWGLSYTNGATGGAGCTSNSDIGGAGGFGGGGGGTFCYRGTAGGGGGYSGGGTGINDAGAGGGGSFEAAGVFDSINTTGGAAPGNGLVIIKYSTDSVGTASTHIISEVTCTGGSNGKVCAILSGAAYPTYTYSWAPGGQTRDTATGLSAGTYTVVVTGCGSATTTVTITQPTAVSVKTAATANVLCNGGNNGSAMATPTGGALPLTYSWLPVASSTNTVSGLSAGSYTVTVTDACGASATSAIAITQPAPLNVKASVTANVTCHGLSNGAAAANVSSGTSPYTYTWNNGVTNSSISNVVAGTYSVMVLDNNGCTGSALITITQPAKVLVTGASTTANVLCNGKCIGSIGSVTVGGTTPYTYSWSNSSTSDTLTGLCIGTYNLKLTDAHGCTASAWASITQPTAVTVVKQSTFDDGHCNGSAWVMVNGGVTPYTYLWNNGNKTAYNYGVCAGSYCCTITDAHGCSDSVCAIVASDLGVANINAADKVTVYPNPNSGQFTITSTATSGTSMVEIYNVLGEKVYTTALNANKGGNATINISNQPNGIYLYRVISNDNGNLVGQGKIVLEK